MNTPLVNLRDARKRHRGPGVPSPCVSICELDERSGSCRGCFRTLQEIAAWGQLNDAGRLEVWQHIEARQVSRTV